MTLFQQSVFLSPDSLRFLKLCRAHVTGRVGADLSLLGNQQGLGVQGRESSDLTTVNRTRLDRTPGTVYRERRAPGQDQTEEKGPPGGREDWLCGPASDLCAGQDADGLVLALHVLSFDVV